jgi:hypothetical protein
VLVLVAEHRGPAAFLAGGDELAGAVADDHFTSSNSAIRRICGLRLAMSAAARLMSTPYRASNAALRIR